MIGDNDKGQTRSDFWLSKLYPVLVSNDETGSSDLQNDTAENTIIEITGTSILKLEAVWLDFATLLQDVTIKVYNKIDGTNYRRYGTYAWTVTTDDDGILIKNIAINSDWKLTITSAIAQGGIKAIPYNIIKHTME